MGASLNFINKNAHDKTIPIDTELSFTYSNCNAILHALGYEGLDEEGCLFDLDVQELAAACLRFVNSEMPQLVDNGIEPTQQGNVIHCGRREGYLLNRVTTMSIACEEARSKGATHAYFC